MKNNYITLTAYGSKYKSKTEDIKKALREMQEVQTIKHKVLENGK